MKINHNKTDDVMWAAQVMQISDRQFLARAYFATHRHRPTADQIDIIYAPYCTHGRTPHWVLRFARDVLANQELTTRPRRIKPASLLSFSLEFGVQLFIRPHPPETLGPDRHQTLVA